MASHADTLPRQHHDAGGNGTGDEGSNTNVGRTERLLSGIAGTVLALYGLKRRGRTGMGAAAVGAALVERAATGHCRLYSALGVTTEGGRLHAEDAAVDPDSAVDVHRSTTVNRPRPEVYAMWRDFTGLPRFMDYLERVEVTDPIHSRWHAKGPAGVTVAWDAEITEDRENERIAWRSVDPADVPNRGSVDFRDAPGGRGTEVHVRLQWDPPLGRAGQLVAKAFRRNPDHELQNALRRFRQVMETGRVPTTEGQPSAREHESLLQALY